MAIFSTLRSQRLATVQTETTEQMITFCLRQEWFALPILAVQKVIPFGKFMATLKIQELALLPMKSKKLLLLMLLNLFFKICHHQLILFPTEIDATTELDIDPSFLDWEQQHYLIIINFNKTTQNLLGLPIEDQPVMRRVTNLILKHYLKPI